MALVMTPLPDFELGTTLGAGQFGTVHAATHTPTGSCVALKLCDKLKMQEDPQLLHRCRQESRLLFHKLRHANIVRCFGAIETPECLCTILSVESGESLAHLVSARGALAEGAAGPIVLQLARALRHCHECKVSHRDVKLDNVVHDEGSGRAVLIDFGLAIVQKTKGTEKAVLFICVARSGWRR